MMMSLKFLAVFHLALAVLLSTCRGVGVPEGSSGNWLERVATDLQSSSLQSSTCAKVSCSTRGGSCGVQGGRLQTCIPPYVCVREQESSDQGSCSAALATEATCTSDAECNSGDFTVFDRYCSSGGKCKQMLKEGDTCGNESVCDQGLKCSEGSCKIAGTPEGQACNSTQPNCIAGTFCNAASGLCKKLLREGENCSSAYPCDVGLGCVNQICVAHYSVKEGGNCGPLSCAISLVCSNSRKCVKPESIRLRECQKAADCESDVAECICDSGSGKKYCVAKIAPDDQTVKLYRERTECIKKNVYDERPCFPKTLKWVSDTVTNKQPISLPELYCLASGIARISVTPLLLLATLLPSCMSII